MLSQKWFALTVASPRERTAASALSGKGFETFLPQYRVRRAWSDRDKTLEMVLFPGYVFCRFALRNRVPVLQTPGVRSIVSFGALPEPVPDHQVAAIQNMLASGAPVEPWPYLEIGQRVRVDRGPLSGVSGILINRKDACRVVLSIELLRRSVAVEIEREVVSPLARAAAGGN